jgi:tetratricopeptide (TPR) repeat protein
MKRTILKAALILLLATSQTRAQSSYDSLIQRGNAQLQSGSVNEALEIGQRAIKLAPDRWQAYALTGGVLMNLKRYEEAADQFSEGIRLAPASKQAQLRDLRKQCVMAETGVAPPAWGTNQPSAATSAPTTTQAEVVLWKSIENSTTQSDFQAYLNQYSGGAFAGLARAHLNQLQEEETRRKKQIAEDDEQRKQQIQET